MDNFRKHNTPRKSSHGGVDGFANRPNRGSQTVRRGSIGDGPRPTSRIDSFKGTDGFKPTTQNPLTTPAPAGLNGGVATARGVNLNQNIKLDLPKSSGKKAKKRNKKRIVLRSFLAIFLVSVLLGGLLFGNAYLKVKGIFGGGGNAPALDANR